MKIYTKLIPCTGFFSCFFITFLCVHGAAQAQQILLVSSYNIQSFALVVSSTIQWIVECLGVRPTFMRCAQDFLFLLFLPSYNNFGFFNDWHLEVCMRIHLRPIRILLRSRIVFNFISTTKLNRANQQRSSFNEQNRNTLARGLFDFDFVTSLHTQQQLQSANNERGWSNLSKYFPSILSAHSC